MSSIPPPAPGDPKPTPPKHAPGDKPKHHDHPGHHEKPELEQPANPTDKPTDGGGDGDGDDDEE
jgi:hypothetical protein